MKKYETPKAEMVKFDYTETVVASGTQTKKSAFGKDCTPQTTKISNCFTSCKTKYSCWCGC